MRSSGIFNVAVNVVRHSNVELKIGCVILLNVEMKAASGAIIKKLERNNSGFYCD